MNYTLQFGDVLAHWPLLAQGLWRTLMFSIGAIIAGTAIGIAGALARGSKSVTLRGIAAVYVEIIRNTPLLVQLFVIFFVLPSAGIRLTTTAAAAIAMALNNGAYTTEILRSGIESVHPSQIEAGLSLGLSRLRVFSTIVLPPAIENVYPALVSQFVLLTLSSSIISTIGADDLTSMANFIQSQNFRSFEVYIVVGVVYLALSFALRAVFWLAGMALLSGRRRRAQPVWA
jgi:polar amino acid transport system permease protein